MDEEQGPDDDPPKDPGLGHHHSSAFEDYEGHRAHSIFVGVGVPPGTHRRRSRHHRHRHHHRHQDSKDDDNRPVTPPSQRVQFILGEEDDGDGRETHPLFSEMETLCPLEGGEFEWKETARWVKFEEDVEEGGERWSKPHVATLSLHSLFELRSFILNGTVILDMDASNLDQIIDLALENLVNQSQMSFDSKEQLKDVLLCKHTHLYEKQKHKENGSNMSRLPLIRSLAEIGRNHSSTKTGGGSGFFRAFSFSGAQTAPTNLTALDVDNLDEVPSTVSIPRNQSATLLDAAGHEHKGNVHFMRKLPLGAEAANILVGEVPFLEKPLTIFIRLNNSCFLGNITEVPVPSRFIFIILGPQGGLSRYHEIGRAMATLLSDEVFHEVAYKGKNRNHLLAGVDEFLDAVTVLPPGEWDPAIRIEPPAAIPSQDARKKQEKKAVDFDEDEDESRMLEAAGLVRTGRWFGGLINDVKRKAPWYLSDFKDALALQSVASFIFLYFACLTPIITFGGLLGEATENRIAAMESLVSGLVCGVMYGFFSGQPLTILGSTGPVLVFETIVYDFCRSNDYAYLSFRLWIGLWVGFILLILVAVDASAMVCYITRFTEENFATLIAFIFIYQAVKKVFYIGVQYPMEKHVNDYKWCDCIPPNNSSVWEENVNWTTITQKECLQMNGTLEGPGCETYYPDVFLLSLILFAGTFLLSFYLKEFKTATFFPSKVRQCISDFAVIIAIVLMTCLDFSIGTNTPKLQVPSQFKPTWEGRTWLIPLFDKNPWYSAPLAFIPALLATILIFMDQQITSVIINRKEHKLKKGGGYHLDLFILALLIIINSIMGLPWFVAATVLAINHVNSLKLESETAAPGEKPQFLGVRENRVTHILIFITIGLSVAMTPILQTIPMPVLFGVFLYMGISALKGIQLFDRILIMFMPSKYQPDYAFLRQVPLKKVHLFTFIQLGCLVCLWVIKSFSQTSILFPLMLIVMVGVRKCLDWIFTQRELKILDDKLPEISRRKKMEREEEIRLREEREENNQNDGFTKDEDMLSITLANGNVMKVPLNPINISEEMDKSGVWIDINHAGQPDNPKKDKSKNICYDNCRKCQKKPKKSCNGVSNGSSRSRRSDGDIKGIVEEEDGKQVNGNHINLTMQDGPILTKKRSHKKKDLVLEDEKKRLSMMAEEEEEDEGITIKIEGPRPKSHSVGSTETSV